MWEPLTGTSWEDPKKGKMMAAVQLLLTDTQHDLGHDSDLDETYSPTCTLR